MQDHLRQDHGEGGRRAAASRLALAHAACDQSLNAEDLPTNEFGWGQASPGEDFGEDRRRIPRLVVRVVCGFGLPDVDDSDAVFADLMNEVDVQALSLIHI